MATLEEMVAQYGPSDRDREQAKWLAIMGASAGLLGARRGNELPALGQGLMNGMQMRQNYLQQATKDRQSAIGMALEMQKFQDAQQLRAAAAQNFQSGVPALPEMGPPTADGAMQPSVPAVPPSMNWQGYQAAIAGLDPKLALQIDPKVQEQRVRDALLAQQAKRPSQPVQPAPAAGMGGASLQQSSALAAKRAQAQRMMENADAIEAIDPVRAEAMRTQAANMLPKFKEDKPYTMNGQRVVVRSYDDGSSEVLPVQPDAEKAHFLDNGATVTPVDPYTGKPVGTATNKVISPEGQARLEESRNQFYASRSVPQFHDGQWVMPPAPNMPPLPGGVRQGSPYQPSTAAPGASAPAAGAPGVMPAPGSAAPVPGFTPKPPDKVTNEVYDIDAQLATIKRGMQLVEQNPGAFGITRGLPTMAGSIPESIRGRFDSPQEREARAYIYNAVSKIINERAGAAQSRQEMARLRAFLPSEIDSATQVRDKLNAFQEYLQERRGVYSTRPQPGGAPNASPAPVGTDRETGKPLYRRADGKLYLSP